MPKEDGKVEAKEEAVSWVGCKMRRRMKQSTLYNTSHPDVKRENAVMKDEVPYPVRVLLR